MQKKVKKMSDLEKRVARVEQTRKAVGISLRALAKEVGCEHTTMLRIASGQTKRITPYLVEAWERSLVELVEKRRKALDAVTT